MISVVIPIWNEEEIIPELLRRLKSAAQHWGDYEVIFVDDGSFDQTSQLLEQAVSHSKELKLLRFSRNFGHQAAVSAGLDHASGEAVVVMDGDLQDPPEIIEQLIAKWHQGFQVVYAVRQKRKEGILKRFCYSLFYRLLKRVAKIDIPLDAGDFSLMDRRVVEVITSLPERNRFIRGLRSWAGFNSVGVTYERSARSAGETKYSLGKLLHLALDGFTAFSTVPLKISEYLGFVIAILSLLVGFVVLILKLTSGIDVRGWTSLTLVIFFVSGVQLFMMGVLGEYVGRIYTEVQNRPVYIVKRKLGFDR